MHHDSHPQLLEMSITVARGEKINPSLSDAFLELNSYTCVTSASTCGNGQSNLTSTSKLRNGPEASEEMAETCSQSKPVVCKQMFLITE